ncbi:PhnD/SsuA/transferrin family substrate-binding protein [Candidatus Pelagibacter sp.]|nr:PhnD/SsuA/transferrin family substrate-binding protein [Candidatus Pelagibacter sp.]
MLKNVILIALMTLMSFIVQANEKTYKMVFVPASEKGDESDYTNLISITEKLTGFKIKTIKVTDYNAAVEAMRAGRAHLAWYGGKTYIKAAEIANAEAFAAGVRPGETNANYYAYFVVKKDSELKKFEDVKGKVLALNTIGSTSGDSIPSYLNFHYKYSYEEMSNFSTKNTGSFGFFRKITSNKLFDLFDPNKIYVRQPLLINFCGYENFKTCKTINPFQKKNKYMPNFNLNSYDYIFSQFTFQTSIFATLLTRTLRYFDIIKVIEPRLIGKVSVQSTIDDILKQSKTRKYDLLIAHIMAPHKPFAWSNGNCEYKYYQNPNFISDRKSQEFHNIEIQCMNKYLRDFLSKLSDDNLLDHYNIIFASDHGARNLNISNNFKDWHSTLYAQRLKNGKYKKINDVKSSQLLFANFFNKEKNNITINKYFDSRSSSYKKIID